MKSSMLKTFSEVNLFKSKLSAEKSFEVQDLFFFFQKLSQAILNLNITPKLFK